MKKTSGFSLLELLVVVAVLAAMGYAFIRYSGVFFQTIGNSRTIASRDNAFTRLTAAVRNPKVLYASLAANAGTQYEICVRGIVGQTCQTTLGNPAPPPNPAPAGFILVDAAGIALAGTPAAPVFYRTDGSVCPALDTRTCIFQAVAYFSATCYGGQPTCTTATSIAVNVVFSTNPAVVASTTNTVANSTFIPKSTMDTMPFMVESRSILEAKTGIPYYNALNGLTCPGGPQSYMYGTNPDGGILCNTWVSKTCPVNYHMISIDSRTQVIHCQLDSFGGGFNRRGSSAGGGCNAADWASNANPCCHCDWPNPLTGKCTCPAGYTEIQIYQYGSLVGTTTTPAVSSGNPPGGPPHTHLIPIWWFSYPFCDDPGPPFQPATCLTVPGQAVWVGAFVCVSTGGDLPQ